MKAKLLLGLFMASAISLTSCSLFDEASKTKEKETTTYPIVDTKTKTETTKTTTETIEKIDQYEVLAPTYKIWSNSIYTTMIKIAIPVKNTGNTDLYLGSMSLDIESLDHKLLDTKTYINGYPEYITPGEIGYYYTDAPIDFTDEEVNIITHTKVEHASNKAIRYDISDITIENDEYYGIKILGRVENKTKEKGTTVKVAINLFDNKNTLITTCFTYLENSLAPNEKVGFTMKPTYYRSITKEEIAKYEVYAYPTQFNISW